MGKAKGERNYGVDLLRVVAMYFVVVLHILNQGGASIGVAEGTIQFHTVHVLRGATYSAVDIFALISGYVAMVSPGRFRPSKIVTLWIRVVFCMLIVTGVFWFFTDRTVFADWSWGTFFTPFYSGTYWYITAYFGLLLAAPILSEGVKRARAETVAAICILGFFVFSLVPTVLESSAFNLVSGYSMVWLCIMFVFGAAYARADISRRFGPLPAIVLMAISLFVTWFTTSRGDKTFLKYTSPTVVIFAVCLLDLFARIKVTSKAGRVIVGFFAETSLSVSILHVHPFVWNQWMLRFASYYHMMRALQFFSSIIVSALTIYVACTAVDSVRYTLFAVTKLPKRLAVLDRLTDRFSAWLCRRLKAKTR